MTNDSNKKWGFVTTIILIIAILNFIVPKIANAGIIDCVTDPAGCFKNALNGLLDIIAAIIAYISAAFLWLAAFLVNFSFNMNLRLDTDGIIGAGWGVTNGLANLGFVLAIIVIAFATILRFQSYNYKQTLFKLITAALLVNFSLLIAFVFIDFSNVLTGYFLKDPTTNKVQVAGSLANAFRIQSMRETATSTTIASIGQDVVVGFTSIAFEVVFNIIVIITLLALAAMMGIRYIALSILLILAPLAWLFWILPFTEKWWHDWWSAFIKWVIFAPAVSLFIYIAIQTVNSPIMVGTISGATKDGSEKMTSVQVSFTANVLGKFANMAVVTGILLGGLITANSMGIAGAKMFYGAATGATKGLAGWTGRKTWGAAKYPFTPPSDKMLDWATDPKAGKFKRAVGSTMVKFKTATSGFAARAGQSRIARYVNNPKTLAGSMLMGAKKGSGLFKGKYAKYWACEKDHLELSVKKPTKPCKVCGSVVWEEAS